MLQTLRLHAGDRKSPVLVSWDPAAIYIRDAGKANYDKEVGLVKITDNMIVVDREVAEQYGLQVKVIGGVNSSKKSSKRAVTARRWEYTLKSGKNLRDAIEAADTLEVVNQLSTAYTELLDAGYIDEDDYASYTAEFMDYLEDDYFDDEEEFIDAVDYELDQFYDLCDNLGVFIPV